MSDAGTQPVCLSCDLDNGPFQCRTKGRLDIGRLAKTWLEHQRLSRGSRPDRERAEALFWAWTCLESLTECAPDTALDVILGALETADQDSTVDALAAGPMEDLIARNGEQVIRRIEEEAWRDHDVRKLLLGVWSQGNDETEIWQRVLRAREGKRPPWMSIKTKRRTKTGKT